MIFSWGIGSKGTNDKSYTLRIPLEISPLSGIQISTEEGALVIGEYQAAILKEKFFMF